MRFSKTKFLAFCKEECKKYNVEFHTEDSYQILCDGNAVSGYFDYAASRPALHIAIGRKDWVEILSHELCHVYQWIENCKPWQSCMNCSVNLDLWIAGKNYPMVEVRKTCKATFLMERDCEFRSLALLRSFGYKYEKRYIKKSNSYTLFYFYIADARKWYAKNKAPYSITIWRKFPDVMEIDVKETYNKLKHLFIQCI